MYQAVALGWRKVVGDLPYACTLAGSSSYLVTDTRTTLIGNAAYISLVIEGWGSYHPSKGHTAVMHCTALHQCGRSHRSQWKVT